jgi:hypothetical protein
VKRKEEKKLDFDRLEAIATSDENLWPNNRERKFNSEEPELPMGYRHLHEPIDVLVQYF